MIVPSLWGESFEIENTSQEVKNVLKKVQNPKSASLTVEQVLKSKKTNLKDKLALITENVLHTLGVYKDNTLVIRTKEQLSSYIDTAIKNGIIAVDTETNNSLDPITCTLMGPCIYTPSLKQAYIPLNHVNPDTEERLENQLTEQDIREQFDRLGDTKVLTHNGSFDYQVIKCTTGYKLSIWWDTMVGARLLDETEKYGLKAQYIQKIDPSIEKYSIDGLFEDIPYQYVDPDIFALYAATDAYMTYKLYEYQKVEFSKPGMEKLFKLFLELEVPLIPCVAEIELAGVCIDQEYSQRLSQKYHKLSEEVERAIQNQLVAYGDIIKQWRETPEANYHPPKKRGEGEGKSKSELLEEPVNLSSPIQLAILLYDVLKMPSVDRESPRGTGEAQLKALMEKTNNPLCDYMLKKRGIDKLLSVFIDKLPQAVSIKDGRLHAHFNQLGTDSGRFSSTNPNLQQIPSHNREVRMMFRAAPGCVFVGGDFSLQLVG